jgi:hypothetical protein
MQSWRTMRPGWGGFFMGASTGRLSLVTVDAPGASPSARRLDELDVLLEELIDELVDVDAAG